MEHKQENYQKNLQRSIWLAEVIRDDYSQGYLQAHCEKTATALPFPAGENANDQYQYGYKNARIGELHAMAGRQKIQLNISPYPQRYYQPAKEHFLHIRIAESEKKEIDTLADQLKMRPSELVRMAIREKLEKHK